MKWIKCSERLPKESCEVVAFSSYGGVINVSYSAKYKRFNCHDWYTQEEAENSGFDSVIAWGLLAELKAEITSLRRNER